jgi:VCBS repeat-containing protein
MSRDGPNAPDGIVNGHAVLPASEVQPMAMEAEPSLLVISTVAEPGAVLGTLTRGAPDAFVSFSLAKGGEHGTVTVDPWGSYTYTPDPGYEGSDSFTFEVTSEDGDTATATVAIIVTVEAPLAIDGSEGRDVLIGGTGDNVINGLGGFDQLLGGLGKDALTLDNGGNATGGEGNDTLTGGSGNDVLGGGTGTDRITAGAGDDTLVLGDGGGLAYGGAGHDTVIGSSGFEQLRGGAGNDLLNTSDGGGRAWGGRGHDTLTGGSGDDMLVGGRGDDVLTGGAGTDEFRFTAGHPRVVETDLILDFEVGADVLDLRAVSIASIEAADLDGDGEDDSLVLLSSGDVIGLIGASGVTAGDLI